MYATLKADIAEWINRADMAARIPTFIRLFEARANRDVRTLDMVKRAKATSSNQFVTLPGDFREAKNVQIGDRPLSFLPMQEVDRKRDEYVGYPHHTKSYSIVGRALELFPTPNENVEIELTYYAEIPPLTDQEPENWLIRKHYDLYLNGSLAHAQPFLMEDERTPLFEGLTQQIIASINLEDDIASHSGSKLVARKRTFG